MKKRQVVFVVFSICFVLSFLLFLFFQKGIGAGMVFQFVFSPLQKITIQSTQVFYEPSTIDQLREENTKLKTQLAKQQLVMQDNKALHDQFEINNPSPKSLLPAHIISMPSFFPGVSAPESLIIDKGKKNGVEEEMVVIIKDNLIGKVTKNNNYFSLVTLIGNKQTSFTAHTTQTNALGVIKGAGNGQLVFDNVVLSDTVKA